jgi:hypothetical protein
LLAFGRLWPGLGFRKAEAGPSGRGFCLFIDHHFRLLIIVEFRLLIVSGPHALHKSASESQGVFNAQVRRVYIFSLYSDSPTPLDKTPHHRSKLGFPMPLMVF